MPQLILARHGNTFEKGQTPLYVGSQTDLPLTEKGHEQAEAIAQYLQRQEIIPTAIFSGNLQRQRQTAAHLASTIHISDALDEIDYGLWEGLSLAQIQATWPDAYTTWCQSAIWPTGIFPKNETFYQSRVKSWLEYLTQTFNSEDVIIGVTSNGLIRYVYSLLDSTWEEKVKEKRIEDLKVKTGHLCSLTLNLGGGAIVEWNVDPRV
ncbi:MAG: histidine phosphatase family protein [Chlamydiia bacterium]|nr:histidine phosphatase family protein [Chlamydiia bacterium]